MEVAYDMLCFRGAILIPNNPAHVRTHVAMTLEKAVTEALASLTPAVREGITQHLINNLGWQIRIHYDPAKIRPYALNIVGTCRMLLQGSALLVVVLVLGAQPNHCISHCTLMIICRRLQSTELKLTGHFSALAFI